MNNLEWYRKKKDLTQEELSRLSDVERSEISRAEKGLKDLKGFEWLSLANVLGCTVDELLGKGRMIK